MLCVGGRPHYHQLQKQVEWLGNTEIRNGFMAALDGTDTNGKSIAVQDVTWSGRVLNF